MKKSHIVMIEAGFVVALLYVNLVMGEFEHNGPGWRRGIAWSMWNVLTIPNIVLGALAGLLGYYVIGFARDATNEESDPST